MQRLASVTIAAALLISAPTFAADNGTLGQFKAEYDITRGGLTIGEITLTLERPSQDAYRYTAFTKPVGLARVFTKDTITETSEGKVSAGHVQPARYEYRQSGKDKRTSSVRFDWQQGKALNDDGESPWTMPITDGVQDKIGHQLGVMLDMSRGQQSTRFDVADGGRLKEYYFRAVGRERIRTPAGEIDSVKVTRSKEAKGESNYTLWLDPQRGFLPVRIDRLDKKWTMILKRSEGKAVQPAMVAADGKS